MVSLEGRGQRADLIQVTKPVKIKRLLAAIEKALQAESGPSGRSEPRLMIASPNRVERKILGKLLEELGYLFVEAGSAVECVAKRDAAIALMIVDEALWKEIKGGDFPPAIVLGEVPEAPCIPRPVQKSALQRALDVWRAGVGIG
jgi:hypothetical protein